MTARYVVRLLTAAACTVAANARAAGGTDLVERRIARIENGFPPVVLAEGEPPEKVTLRSLMALYKVSGLSVAVIDGFRIAWARGYGVTASGGSTRITDRTVFQAGSVSKPVAAAAALWLVERGKLSLDEDVNRWLRSWKVPENEFTREKKVTLRRILTHTAGFTVHGLNGYRRGEPVPTLPQILDGAQPAKNEPIRVDFVPGSRWRYSGGGYLVAQQLMTDVAGMPFPQLARKAVFDPIGMRDSTYENPLPEARAPAAASGTEADGTPVEGKWFVYPEMAAAGLWTTPSDLARFAIEIASAKRGKSNRVLSQAMAEQTLAPQVKERHSHENAWGDDEHPDRMGLGFFVGDERRPDRFGHVGDDEGFQAELIMFADTGQGAVVMANSLRGIRVGNYLINQIAREYGWNYVPPSPLPGPDAVLLSVARRKNVGAVAARYRELKRQATGLDHDTLIGVGYELFWDGRLSDAIEIMKLAVAENPDYWNAHDSLGEMYAHAGQKELAIASYERSVALNPDNHTGIAMLKKLR